MKLLQWLKQVEIIFRQVALIFTLTAMIVVMFWSLDSRIPLTVESPMLIVDDNFQAGDTAGYIIDYCKTIDKPFVLSRELHRQDDRLDIIGLPTYSVGTPLPMGCHELVSNNIRLPVDLDPGHYKMVVYIRYQINPIKTLYIEFETTTFNVM
jgi:hypothetical protein